MIFLDAYAVVAILAEERAAPDVERLLRSEETGILIVNLSEALDVLQRVRRAGRAETLRGLDLLAESGLRAVDAGIDDAIRAADLRLAYYNRRLRPLSNADCLLLAAPIGSDAIATSDPHVAEVARAEGIGLVPLPDSNGRLPP